MNRQIETGNPRDVAPSQKISLLHPKASPSYLISEARTHNLQKHIDIFSSGG